MEAGAASAFKAMSSPWRKIKAAGLSRLVAVLCGALEGRCAGLAMMDGDGTGLERLAAVAKNGDGRLLLVQVRKRVWRG